MSPRTFTFHLSPEERATLEHSARAAGESLGAYIRRVLFEHEHDLPARVSELERRLAALERLAERG